MMGAQKKSPMEIAGKKSAKSCSSYPRGILFGRRGPSKERTSPIRYARRGGSNTRWETVFLERKKNSGYSLDRGGSGKKTLVKEWGEVKLKRSGRRSKFGGTAAPQGDHSEGICFRGAVEKKDSQGKGRVTLKKTSGNGLLRGEDSLPGERSSSKMGEEVSWRKAVSPKKDSSRGKGRASIKERAQERKVKFFGGRRRGPCCATALTREKSIVRKKN